MIIPYYSYYIIILIPPLIWNNEWKIRNITSVLNIMSIVCYIFFIIWPIDTNHVLGNVQEERYPLKIFHDLITYDYLYQNAFPSMHVVVSSFLCLAYYNDFKAYRYVAVIIGISIFFATFLIKQHYILDSLLGLLIACIGFYYYRNKVEICK